MKTLSLLILTLLAFSHIRAQTGNALGIDCNPRLNEKEISHLNTMFASSNYDFRNKTIGFASHHVNKLCKTGTVYLSGSWPIDKKEYFTALEQDRCSQTVSKLLILNDEQKKESKGFDAIVLVIKKKNEKRVDAKMIDKFAEVFGYSTLNYPDNLHLVGNDNSSDLTDEDVAFFNQIYHDRDFDFKNKKIAFINPHLNGQESIRTKKEFIEKIKKHLENDFLYPASEDLAILTETEKKETGGYDAMIIYQNKKSWKGDFFKILKESSRR